MTARTLAVLLAAATAGLTAQDRPTFRGGISLVEVSVLVTGAGDRPVTDLMPDEFEVFEDGQRRPVTSVRFLRAVPSPTPPALPASLDGARVDRVATNRDLADAPAFVLLLDDLNVSPYDAHRAIRAGLGIVDAVPRDALLSVVSTSGGGGALVTLERPTPAHAARVREFRGQLVLAGPQVKNPMEIATTPSSVDAPCGVGSEVLNSPDCSDPTRAGRRAGALQAIGELFARTGSRRKVLVWLTTDMGVSPLDPDGNRAAQFAGLQRLLGGDVTVYAIDPRENEGSFVASGGGLGRPDRRTGGRFRVGPADRMLGGGGAGTTLSLDTDDMVGVPLTQLARETGGRWIQNANNIEKVAAEVVTQNLSAYVLAYESASSGVVGRHTIEVKVKRKGVKVSSRRAFVVPEPDAAPTPREGTAPDGAAPLTAVNARLREIVRGGVPSGSLALRAHVATQFAVDGPARALVTLRVDEDTTEDADAIDLLVLAAADDGSVAAVERLSMQRPARAAAWEGSVTLALPRGAYQLRVAAATPDGTRAGLLLHPLEIEEAGTSLALGVPTLLGGDDRGVRPTLARTFPVGHPLAYQVEVAGEAVRRGEARVSARLLDARGAEVRAREGTREAGAATVATRVTGVVDTEALPPGAYVLVIQAAPAPAALTHAIPITLTDAVPASATFTSRTLTPLAVAHGPLTRHPQRGPFLIRTEPEWTAFWRTLPTRQPAPDIDFARVTLLAIVSDAEPQTPAVPRITTVRTEPGGLVVDWTTEPGAALPAGGSEPLRPFVVMGLTSVDGHVRFERVDTPR